MGWDGRQGTAEQEQRIRQLERDLAVANDAVLLLKQQPVRRTSLPSLSTMELETAQESISNRLARQIEQLRRERGELCHQVEAEEEFIMNSLQRRLEQVQKEKVELEAALEQEQESLVNRMKGCCLSSEEVSPVAAVGGGALHGSPSKASRCSSALSSLTFGDPTDSQKTISTLQGENYRLLAENVRLSQLLRRHNINPASPQPIPLKRCDSNLSDGSRSGSISDLRQIAGRTDDDEDAAVASAELCANISPIRPAKQFQP